MEGTLGEDWSLRNIFRRLTCRKPIRKRKKPNVGGFLPTGRLVPFKQYVQMMGETPDLLEARPPGWDENKEERRINKKMRRTLSCSIAFASLAMFLFSYGYNQISLMQDHLHESQFFMQIKYMPDPSNTYGHVQLCAKYGLAAVTAMFAPYLMRIYKDKWILFVTISCFSTFISLGFLDAKYTIMPSGFLAGLATIPLFTTFSMYMVNITQRLGDLNQKRPYNGTQGNWLLVRFNTFVFFAWYFGFACASGTSAVVFHGVLVRNESYVHFHKLQCGAKYCDRPWPNWWDVLMQQDEIPQIDNYAFANIANACCGIIATAIVLFFCVEGQTEKTFSSLKEEKGFELNFKLGWRALFSWNRTILAPIFIFTGWSMDFVAYSYTRAFIICSIDSWMMFISLASFGLCAAMVAGLGPWIAISQGGTRALMIMGVCCHGASLLFLMFWQPVASIIGYKFPHAEPQNWEWVAYNLVPGVWGVGAAALHVAINLKIEFEYRDTDEMLQMFTLFYHWRAVGVVIGYVTRSTATCTYAKIYGLFANLLIAVPMYLWYESRRLKQPNAVTMENVRVVRFVPNPNPDDMANESDVEEEGTSTSEEEGEEQGGADGAPKRKKLVRYKRKPPPNNPLMGQAWRTPYFPPDLEIPRKYITPDGNIMIMPKHCKPPFEVQDSFDSNVLRDTDLERVSKAARKVKYQLGFGGEPLFFEVEELLNDPRDAIPTKFDARGEVIPGMEDEPDFPEEHLASNPRHHIQERFELALEALKRKREDDAANLEENDARLHFHRDVSTTDEEAHLLSY